MSARVTIHMAASLDGFIARKDGSVDWMETRDEFVNGESLDPEFIRDFLARIDCYVMGSKTYELALSFEAKGYGWQYGDKPMFVLTHRELPRIRQTVEFYAGDLRELFKVRLPDSHRGWNQVFRESRQRCRATPRRCYVVHKWNRRAAIRGAEAVLTKTLPHSG